MASRQTMAELASQLGGIAQLRAAATQMAEASLVAAQRNARSAAEDHANAFACFGERMEQWQMQLGEPAPDPVLLSLFRGAVAREETALQAASSRQADAQRLQTEASSLLALSQAKTRLAQDAVASQSKRIANRREHDQSLLVEDMMIALWGRAQ